MAFDKLLESQTPKQTLAGAGVYTGDWVYIQPGVLATWRLVVGGDITGTNPTLDTAIEGSTSGVGAANATLANFTQVTTEMVGYVATTTPRPEVPGTWPLFVTTRNYNGVTKYPWQRAKFTVGGTATPTFPLVSCDPYKFTDDETIQSGGADRDTTVYLA